MENGVRASGAARTPYCLNKSTNQTHQPINERAIGSSNKINLPIKLMLNYTHCDIVMASVKSVVCKAYQATDAAMLAYSFVCKSELRC